MFGQNPLSKKDHGDGETLLIKDIFPTIQGEGPFIGRAAVFIRLAGCHLKCHFCDTDFDGGEKLPLDSVVRTVSKLATRGKTNKATLVVLTGGEPMRQNILPLCRELASSGYIIQMETAGNFWIEGLDPLVWLGDLSIVCSPKTGKVHPLVEKYCRNWKYIVRVGDVSEEDGLPEMSTQVVDFKQKLYRPSGGTIWVQPCDEYKTVMWRGKHKKVQNRVQTRRNMKLAAQIAMKYNYRLSVQTHKVVGLP